MIVVDASAALSALLNDGPARKHLISELLHAPHLIDSEVASGLRRRVSVGALDTAVAWTALDTWRRLGILRHPVFPLLHRVWALRDHVTAYDASYVALAEALECGLLSADARLSGAPGVLCPITVVPR